MDSGHKILMTRRHDALFRLPLILLTVLIVAFFTFVTSCSDLSDFDRVQVKSAMLDSLITTSESWDVEMTLFKDQDAQLRVYASKATTYQSPVRKEVVFDGPVTVVLFDPKAAGTGTIPQKDPAGLKRSGDESDEPTSGHQNTPENGRAGEEQGVATARSGRAIYRESSGEFELFDDVRVDTKQDRHLRSDYLKWSDDDNRIQSPEFVTIITPADSISGYGFEGAMDLSEYTITRPRGRVLID